MANSKVLPIEKEPKSCKEEKYGSAWSGDIRSLTCLWKRMEEL